MHEQIIPINRDLIEAKSLGPKEARYLVDMFYSVQEQRKRASNQLHSMNNQPSAVLQWFVDQWNKLEHQLAKALDEYSDSHPVAKDAKQNVLGIGPVISAGLLAHIDVKTAKTAGSIWRFAGLDPSIEWAKGEKRPYNARLKVLCWKIGESFVRLKNRPDCFYGALLEGRWKYEKEKNESKAHAHYAQQIAKNFGKHTRAYSFYKQGLLPPAHVAARAKRWVTKLFLSHWFEKMYEYEFNKQPPRPYVFDHVEGHIHYIPPPW